MNDLFRTEGVRYSGSKRLLLSPIDALIGGLGVRTALDAFAGTTRVAQFFKRRGFSVHANDLAPYTAVFAEAYLLADPSRLPRVHEKLAFLSSLTPVDGYFTSYYAADDDGTGRVCAPDGRKRPLLRKNAMKLDAIRDAIESIAEDRVERAVLLTSLLLALDRVENSLGHQAAWLSRWAPRCFADLRLLAPALITGRTDHAFTSLDARYLSGSYDLAYLDPPYNTNNTHTPTTRVRYASYYHFWTTVVKNDRPDVVGAAQRRFDCSSDRLPGAVSAFESTRYEEVLGALRQLVLGLDTRYLLLSYSNKGKLRRDDIIEVLRLRGEPRCVEVAHRENVQKRLTSNQKWLGDPAPNIEYLFLVGGK